MTGSLTIQNSEPHLYFKDPEMDTTLGTPTSSNNMFVMFQDKNGRLQSRIQSQFNTNGTSVISIGSRRVVGGTDVNNNLDISVKNDGSRVISVTEPAAWRTALNAVNKAGDTITGNLTLDPTGIPRIFMKNSLADVSRATDTASRTWSFYHTDVNGKLISFWESNFNTAGRASSYWGARRIVGTSTIDNIIQMTVAADGTRSVSVSSPDGWRKAIGFGELKYSQLSIANNATSSFTLDIGNAGFIATAGAAASAKEMIFYHCSSTGSVSVSRLRNISDGLTVTTSTRTLTI